jgi:hypothetical protein
MSEESPNPAPEKRTHFEWPPGREFRSFQEWACACAKPGLRGPYKLIGSEPADYQYVGDTGTAAVWRSASNWGVIRS